MSRSMRVKFISSKYWSYFPFFMANIFPPPTQLRRFRLSNMSKSYFYTTKPPRKHIFPEKRTSERRENVQPKITQFTDTSTHFIPLWTKKAKERKCFSDVENVHNALNTIKCDNMAGCDSHICNPPRRPFCVSHYTKRAASHTPGGLVHSTRFIPRI